MQTRSEETRSHILSAALEHFAGKGYAAASVDDICTAAGVSKGAFYHHFPTKQSVFLALFEDWLATVDAGLESARLATVPETLIHMASMLPVIFAQAGGRLPMFLEFWLQASRDEAIWRATIAPYQRYHAYFTALIEQGKAEGSFRADVDAAAVAQGLVAMAVGMLLQGLLSPDATDWERIARLNVEMLLNSLKQSPV